MNAPQRQDLETRLVDYGARIVRLCRHLETSKAAAHVAGQLLRSGTAPLAHHGEAQDAESRRDFIHKLKLSLKELRESYRWLLLIQRAGMLRKPAALDPLIAETDELIRIFVTSTKTAQRNGTSE
ncbi:MAG TPA: four helix bundle protein [Verrucomicrobiae bacterium]|nr:four helix bundle protein [Verrucomicrobiae bacterium]